jgi:hypothetical protein
VHFLDTPTNRDKERLLSVLRSPNRNLICDQIGHFGVQFGELVYLLIVKKPQIAVVVEDEFDVSELRDVSKL